MKIWKVWEFKCNIEELKEELNDLQRAGKKIESVSSVVVSNWGRCYEGIVVYTEEDSQGK